MLFSNVTLASEIARPTSQKILFNFEEVEGEVYNINGSNYFKLRDIAAILNGTSAQFSIEYDGAIHITTKNEYTFVGNELSKETKKEQIANKTTSSIFINGIEVFPYTYNINGNNYFGIRFLGENLGFGVEYDQFTNTVLLTADKNIKYDVEAIDSDDNITNKRNQFKLYKDKMNEAQKTIENLYNKVKKEEGRSKSKKQVYAYIALGNWMTKNDVNNLKFAKLDVEALNEKYEITLPIIEGTMSDGKNIKSEYYLISDGKIFIYPPYIYDSKEYINEKMKMQDGKIRIGSIGFDVEEIAKSQTFDDIPIKEENDKNIEIITAFNTGFTLDKRQVLEFSFSKYNYPGFSLIVNDIDLRNDVIKANVYCNNEKIMDIENLYPYCEKNYANISTGQVYINEAYHNKVLTIKFYRNDELFAEGKIKLIK